MASKDIPQYLKDATVAIEDKRFYKHDGVDWKRTFGAFYNIFMNSRSNFGGSTITQQLIKNLTDEKEVTVRRKLLEIFRALEFDKTYDKDVILEWYLNTIYLGQGCYGVKTASEVYFAKNVSELTLAECASLIGITNGPTMYDPYQNPEQNKERQEQILGEMLEQGLISKKDYNDAKSQELDFRRMKSTKSTSRQSYFVDQVIEDVITDLQREKDVSRRIAEKMIYSSGYSIYTTVDTRIQGILDEVFTDEKNFPKTYSEELPQAAMVIVEPTTGNIVGIAGGRGEKQLDRGLNRATQSYRQPGSSIKPVTVYTPAIDSGLVTPFSSIDDAPLKLSSTGRQWPKNSTNGGVYSGRMTIIRAVELSINTIPVQLVNQMGPEVSFNFATNNMGLESLVRELKKNDKVYSDIGLASMALGGLTRGVSVRDLTAAYAAFGNNGIYTKPRTYTQVVDSHDNVVLDNTPQTTAAMKPETAFYMNYMLQSVVKRGTGTSAAMKNMAVAGKTGTTDEDKDRWFMGYTPYYVGGVWFGFDDPQEIDLEKTKNPALTMWKIVMDKVHEGLPARQFPQPESVVSASFCLDSGMAPTSNCRNDVRGSRVSSGLYFPRDIPNKSCDVHVGVKVDTSTGRLATSFCPPEVVKNLSIMKINRYFNMPGVVLSDQAYTMRGGTIPEGAYPPSGGSYYAVYCDVHDADWVPPPVSPQPGVTPEGVPSPAPGGVTSEPTTPAHSAPPASEPPATEPTPQPHVTEPPSITPEPPAPPAPTENPEPPVNTALDPVPPVE